MKNKSTMLLVGIGVAYLLYRLYAKNRTMLPPVNTTASTSPTPTILRTDTEQIISNAIPSQFLVDKVRDESINYDMPSTYQTFYARPNNNIAGAISKVPSTC
jgi:hypothetical protein